jgi:hypothetical protein
MTLRKFTSLHRRADYENRFHSGLRNRLNNGIIRFLSGDVKSINQLQTRQRDELIIDKLKNAVKAGYHKDAACGILYAAQDKAVVDVFEDFAQLEHLGDTRRGNDINIRKIHHHIATAPVPYNFDNRPQFFTHLRFLGEGYQYYIF